MTYAACRITLVWLAATTRGGLQPALSREIIVKSLFGEAMICPRCRAQNPDDALHCVRCGGVFRVLDEEETVVAPRPATPPTSLPPEPTVKDEAGLTDRQLREIEYHRQRAKEYKDKYGGISYEVIHSKRRRWWNAYWGMYRSLLTENFEGKRVLVIGCGFGDDALRISKMGAEVHAFDLSPDVLAIAIETARREGLNIAFRQMPAEHLEYESDLFDVVVVRDIFHHVRIPDAIGEIVRVSRDGALLVVNEVYSHSITDKIRYSAVVVKFLYPLMKNFVYGGEKPYITKDERKLTERDVQIITQHLGRIKLKRFYNFLVGRIFPDRFSSLNRLDYILLQILKPIGHVLGGRILLIGVITKCSSELHA